MENKIFTIENVPKKLDKNQFYCFNKDNGQILLGKILGKTLDEQCYFFKIKNSVYRVSLGFTNREKVVIAYNYVGFNNYEDLKSCDETYKSRKLEKTREKEGYKYCVNKFSYSLEFTNPNDLFGISNFKIFDTKKEAEEYSLKGLKKIKKYSLLFTEKLNTLLKEIEEKQRLIGTEFTLTDFLIKDLDELKVGDYLLKVEQFEIIEKYFPYNLLKGIKSEFKLKVEEVISNRLIRLNNDFILEEFDFRYNYKFFKAENIEKIKLAINYSNLETIKSFIKDRLVYLKELDLYCKLYDENKSTPKDEKYFVKKSYEEIIKVVNNFLITNKIKMRSYDYQK